MDRRTVTLMGGGIDPYAVMSSLLVASDYGLSKQERVKRAVRRKLAHEESIRQSKIRMNICPQCDGKLVRGKKDKKNDYRRMWSCTQCATIHAI